VRTRVEHHQLEDQALVLLRVCPLGDRRASGVHALGEVVTDTLELAQIEHARLGGRASRLLEPAHRIGGDEGVGKLALESGDLPAQRASRCALRKPILVLDGAKYGRRVRDRDLRSVVRPPEKLHCSLLY
jgi:hypothetical protein